MEGNAVNVLFLEDEPTIREVLAEYMKLSGYRVTEIARGDAAIALLQENVYSAPPTKKSPGHMVRALFLYMRRSVENQLFFLLL